MTGLCVVVPHRSRVDLLEHCLESVGDAPVVVVDDSDAGLLLDVATVRLGGGRGFAAAANAGLAWAAQRGFDRAVVLNDDAFLLSDCLEELASVDADLVGPVIEDTAGGVESAGLNFSERSGRLRQRVNIPKQETEVPALSGACLLMPTRLRFDLAFQHGMEDVDLCRRVRKKGGRVVLNPRARCRHVGGATVDRRSPEATRDALRGHLRLVRDSPIRRALVVGYAVGQVLREGPLARLGGVAQALL